MYLSAFDLALEQPSSVNADVRIVSSGIDTYALDPPGKPRLSSGVYAECGRRLAFAAQRLVLPPRRAHSMPPHLGESVRTF